MNSDRNAEVRHLFGLLEGLDRGLTDAERLAWLDERCKGDAALSNEVWELYQGMLRQKSGFLEPPTFMTRPEDLLGRELHEYRLDGLLGVGGMGAVYRAFSKHGRKQVAVKVLHPSFVGEQENRRRFQLEVELIGRLNHPNIVRLHTAGEDRGLLWFAMDLIDGWSLEELIKRRRVGDEPPLGAPDINQPAVVAEIMCGVANALACAHERGVLHRDVKPGNLLLDQSGSVHLADFGLARVLDSESATLTGLVGGTCLYMSPEQARQLKDAVTAHSDIYSAGAVLYELLAGEPPFGLDSSPAVLRKIAEREVPAISRRRPKVATGLALCAQKALRLVPEERYSSAQEMAKDLSRWIDGRPVLARPPSLLARARSASRSKRAIPAAALGVAVATMLGASRIIWLNNRASVRADWVELSISGSKFPPGTLVGYTAYGAHPADVEDRADFSPLETEWNAKVPPGVINVVIQSPDGLQQEFVRVVQPKEEIEITAGPSHSLPESFQFIEVEGGRHELEYPITLALTRRLVVDIPDFEMSEKPVSNREFELFAQASGFGRSAELQAQMDRFVSKAELPEWGDLPATGIDFELAQRAAEWWGCRLPTRAEWEFAINRHGLVGQPPHGPKFELRESSAPQADGKQRSRFLDYSERVQLKAAVSGLEQADLYLANVTEWTSSPALHFIGDRVAIIPGEVFLCGVDLDTHGVELDPNQLEFPRTTYTTMPSGDVGFRLVRTKEK